MNIPQASVRTAQPRRYWVAVASAEHARLGKAGFMQVNHGKEGPLKRLRMGDGILYYSPTETFRGKDRLQAFTLIGYVHDERVYQVDMGTGFMPYRRDVDYAVADEAPIRPLLDKLEMTRGKSDWGYRLRFGLVEITRTDFVTIAEAMQARFPAPAPEQPCGSGAPVPLAPLRHARA